MRYGNPCIDSALEKLQHCNDITIVPLFPQYSSAATGSAVEKCMHHLASLWNIPAVTIVRDFYNDPGFIAACADIIKSSIADKQIDMLLFSYHGLPERHIKKSACHAACDHTNPCPQVSDLNSYCYRAQCYETSTLLAEKLALSTDQYRVSFQSRLGRTPWIKPYTDLLLPELIKQGVKNIAIACPSFVADCLETLEEINIRAREQWKSLGGNEFTYIPCINDHPMWVKSLAKMITYDKRSVSAYSEMMSLINKL
jgi:ferrochelatase